MSDDLIQQRKLDHLRIVADGGANHGGTTLLECVELEYNALPELNLDGIDTSTQFFGKPLRLPLMITSMSGGVELAQRMNTSLARACSDTGIALALGSQRVMLTHPGTRESFSVRELIPDGVLLGNIGGQQLLEYPANSIAGLVSEIEADGLCIHLNPAHELAQIEGDRNFSGILEKIAQVNQVLEGRVLVKEVGHGLSGSATEQLVAAGIRYIDVAGAGGTSWTRVEALRNPEGGSVGEAFAGWGIPTALALIEADSVREPGTTLVASGGIRSGIDVARCIALGAGICGFAQPALAAFLSDPDHGVQSLLERFGRELRAAMLLCSTADLESLGTVGRIIRDPLWTMAEQNRKARNG